MSDIFGKIKTGAGKVAHEADRVARVKRIELDIGQLKKQIEGHYQKVGELTYRSKVNNEAESPEISNISAKITDLMKQISQKEEEIKKINEDVEKPQSPSPSPQPPQQTQSAVPQGKICTNCGKENDPNVKFCSECGTKMP
jgi:chromosome segregation ATPase